MYNVTALFNHTSMVDYVRALDSESGNILGIVILGVTLSVFMLTFWKEGVGTSLTASGFVGSLVSIILFGLGILKPHFIIYPVLLFAAGLIAKKLGGGS